MNVYPLLLAPIYFLKFINRQRLQWREEKRCRNKIKHLNYSNIHHSNARPKSVRSILVINPYTHFGDCLFANGLIKALSNKCSTDLVVFESFRSVFSEGGNHANHIFVFNSPSDLLTISKTTYDLVIDIGKGKNEAWNERKAVLEKVFSYTITCDPYLEHTNIYSEYLKIDFPMHFSKKMAKILTNAFQDTQCEWLPPCFDNKDNFQHPYGPYVYFNTLGGQREKCLSTSQIQHVLDWFQLHQDINVYLYSSQEHIKKLRIQSSNIIVVFPNSFVHACQIIKNCIAVITPDSSPVHMASALNIPILAFYQGRNPYFFGDARKSWYPLSRQFQVIEPSSYWNPNLVPINKITNTDLNRGLDWLENVLFDVSK